MYINEFSGLLSFMGNLTRLRKNRPRAPGKINIAILQSDHDYLADAALGEGQRSDNVDKPQSKNIDTK